ncbi:glyoxalase [Brachybacterium sp. P6-10-X1]|nr:VOC family protein [Brachybacterium sp. P6-10-X1]APX34640.1 glyoxalase [Brachybacterium sp. P6-10-X1]
MATSDVSVASRSAFWVAESRAEQRHVDVGLAEVAKPPALAGRGGCWFRHIEDGAVLAEIHCGIEDPFHPARTAHPALVVDTAEQLERMAARIESVDGDVDWAERTSFEGYPRFHARDPFGNRLEVLTPD